MLKAGHPAHNPVPPQQNKTRSSPEACGWNCRCSPATERQSEGCTRKDNRNLQGTKEKEDKRGRRHWQHAFLAAFVIINISSRVLVARWTVSLKQNHFLSINTASLVQPFPAHVRWQLSWEELVIRRLISRCIIGNWKELWTGWRVFTQTHTERERMREIDGQKVKRGKNKTLKKTRWTRPGRSRKTGVIHRLQHELQHEYF